MKMLYHTIAAVAIMNVLALAGLGAFLVAGDLVDMRRAREVADLLGETVTERDAREAAEAAEAEAEAIRLASLPSEEPPLRADQWVDRKLEQDSAYAERLSRLRREVEDLRRSLTLERQELAAERSAFEDERDAFNRVRREIAEAEGDERFRKALATYEGLRPAAAQEVFQELIDRGEIDQVVAYLDKMQTRGRAKIVSEFQKADPAVAADLLERLRTRGIEAQAESRASAIGP